MLLDPDRIVPHIPTIAAQLLNVVYERVALTGGDPRNENTFRADRRGPIINFLKIHLLDRRTGDDQTIEFFFTNFFKSIVMI